jgi:hypothetical protein
MKVKINYPPSKELLTKDLKPNEKFMFVDDLDKPENHYREVYEFIELEMRGNNLWAEARTTNGGKLGFSPEALVVRVYIEEVVVKII